jgi:RNA 2',3'-cyclic 3'-phosphodiesterase
LFFALWPDRALQVALADATQGVVLASGGRPMPAENFHVTLAFVGSVPESRVAKLEVVGRQVAAEVERAPVQLTMDSIEYWKKAKVVCATVQVSPSPGAQVPQSAGARLADTLSTALKSRLTAAGFTPDLKEFRPHVTLARKVSHPTPTTDMDPLVWRFTEFALVDSRTEPGGSAYRVLASFPWGHHEGVDP